jgi:hypothetical protein
MPEHSDTFSSPNNAKHRYDVLHVGADIYESDLDAVDSVTVLSSDGAVTVKKEDVLADRLRRKPQLGAVPVAQAVESANFRWALEDVDENGGNNA